MSKIANITIGSEYFRRNARNDYSNPLPFVWIREAIQNSIDAGATVIDIKTDGDYITLTDNGCGMSEPTITYKLLTLGGTEKESGSVGGFGKAKEILFFSWDEWSIDTSVNGTDRLFISNHMIGTKPIKQYIVEEGQIGTTIKIKTDTVKIHSWVRQIKAYISRCTTKCEIILNGEVLEQFKITSKYKNSDWYNITVEKENPQGAVFVRVSGVLMFIRHLYKFESTIIIELVGDNTKLLAGNRDSLVYEYSSALDEYINSVIINPKSAAMQEVKPQIDMYAGLSIKERLADMNLLQPELDMIEEMHAKCTQNGITNFYKMDNLIATKVPELSNVVSTFIKNECDTIGPMGYSFIVKRDGKKKPNIKIESKRAQTILHYWTNIILKLAVEYDVKTDIGIGLTFTEDSIAEFVTIKGKNFFLINPNKIDKTSDKLPLGIELFMAAAHEFSHMWYVDHTEHFSSKMGSVLKSLSTNWNEWNDLFIYSKREVLEAFS